MALVIFSWVSMRKILLFAILVFSLNILIAERISYVVNFKGLQDVETLDALKSASQLISLQKKKPSSQQALRFRAESDFPALLKILQNYGYLEASLDLQLEKLMHRYLVNIQITPGPRYQIENYQALPELDLGLGLKGPLIAQKILDADLKLLKLLSEKAYPFAAIKNREIIADGETKTAKVIVEVDKGPLSTFGPATIHGLKNVRPQFVKQKLQWEEKQPYNSQTVNEAQKELMDTGLFSSVYITHPQTPEEDQSLPMNVDVVESKHKSISVAASFQMTYGPGIAFGWENRNLGGMGRKLSLSLDIAQHNHSGTAALVSPDFIRPGQDFMMQAEASSEEVTAFQDRTYNFLVQIDRGLSDSLKASLGLKPEMLLIKESVENGTFFVLQLPFSLKYSTVDNSLHATNGTTFEYQATAALNFKESTVPYFSQNFTYCNFIPVLKEDVLVLAQKISLQSIFSSNLDVIPVPKRILGGSEDNLRGYRYLTVSPLKEGIPTGGQSALYYSLEPRFRLNESIGIVPFFDFGNVFASPLPDFKGKWFKSLGMGFRYFSFLGPLRLDLAFPLDRRQDLDPKWWVFASLGQSF